MSATAANANDDFKARLAQYLKPNTSTTNQGAQQPTSSSGTTQQKAATTSAAAPYRFAALSAPLSIPTATADGATVVGSASAAPNAAATTTPAAGRLFGLGGSGLLSRPPRVLGDRSAHSIASTAGPTAAATASNNAAGSAGPTVVTSAAPPDRSMSLSSAVTTLSAPTDGGANSSDPLSSASNFRNTTDGVVAGEEEEGSSRLRQNSYDTSLLGHPSAAITAGSTRAPTPILMTPPGAAAEDALCGAAGRTRSMNSNIANMLLAVPRRNPAATAAAPIITSSVPSTGAPILRSSELGNTPTTTGEDHPTPSAPTSDDDDSDDSTSSTSSSSDSSAEEGVTASGIQVVEMSPASDQQEENGAKSSTDGAVSVSVTPSSSPQYTPRAMTGARARGATLPIRGLLTNQKAYLESLGALHPSTGADDDGADGIDGGGSAALLAAGGDLGDQGDQLGPRTRSASHPTCIVPLIGGGRKTLSEQLLDRVAARNAATTSTANSSFVRANSKEGSLYNIPSLTSTHAAAGGGSAMMMSHSGLEGAPRTASSSSGGVPQRPPAPPPVTMTAAATLLLTTIETYTKEIDGLSAHHHEGHHDRPINASASAVKNESRKAQQPFHHNTRRGQQQQQQQGGASTCSSSSAAPSLVDYLIDRQIQQQHEDAANRERIAAQKDEIRRYKSALKGLTVSKGYTTEAQRAAAFHSANAKLVSAIEASKHDEREHRLRGAIAEAVNDLYGRQQKGSSNKNRASGGAASSTASSASAFHDPRFPLLCAAHRKEVLRMYDQLHRGKELLKLSSFLIREAYVLGASAATAQQREYDEQQALTEGCSGNGALSAAYARFKANAAAIGGGGGGGGPAQNGGPSSCAAGASSGIPNALIDALGDLSSRLALRRKERQTFLTHYDRAAAAAERSNAALGRRQPLPNPEGDESHQQQHEDADDYESSNAALTFASPAARRPPSAASPHRADVSPITAGGDSCFYLPSASPAGLPPSPSSFGASIASINHSTDIAARRSYLDSALSYLKALNYGEWQAQNVGGGGGGAAASGAAFDPSSSLSLPGGGMMDAALEAKLRQGLMAKGGNSGPNARNGPSLPQRRLRRDTAYPSNALAANRRHQQSMEDDDDEDDIDIHESASQTPSNPRYHSSSGNGQHRGGARYPAAKQHGAGRSNDDSALLESETYTTEEEDEDDNVSDYSSQDLGTSLNNTINNGGGGGGRSSSGEGTDPIRAAASPTANNIKRGIEAGPLGSLQRNKNIFENICKAAHTNHPLARDEEMARREKLRQLFVEEVQQLQALSVPGKRLAASLPREFGIVADSSAGPVRALSPVAKDNPYRFSQPAQQRFVPEYIGGSPTGVKHYKSSNMAAIRNNRQRTTSHFGNGPAGDDDGTASRVSRRRLGGQRSLGQSASSFGGDDHHSNSGGGGLVRSASVRFADPHSDYEQPSSHSLGTSNPLSVDDPVTTEDGVSTLVTPRGGHPPLPTRPSGGAGVKFANDLPEGGTRSRSASKLHGGAAASAPSSSSPSVEALQLVGQDDDERKMLNDDQL